MRLEVLHIFPHEGNAPTLSSPDRAHRRATRPFALAKLKQTKKMVQCGVARLAQTPMPQLLRTHEQQARVDKLEPRPTLRDPNPRRPLVVRMNKCVHKRLA